MPTKQEYEVYDKLEELSKKEDLSEFVEYSISLVDISLPEKDRYEHVLKDFFQDKFRYYDDKDEAYELSKRFNKAYTQKSAECYLAFADKMEDCEQKIRNGEVDKAFLIMDDRQKVNRLAAGMAFGSDTDNPDYIKLMSLLAVGSNADAFTVYCIDDMEEAEEISNQAFKDTMDSFTIYSPEQKKKYQDFLMTPPQNGQVDGGLFYKFQTVDHPFTIEPVKLYGQIMGCKTHEELNGLCQSFEDRIKGGNESESMKNELKKSLDRFDKAHDRLDLNAMPEYNELLDLRGSLRVVKNARKTMTMDDVAAFRSGLEDARTALKETAELLAQDAAGRKPGDMSQSYKDLVKDLDEFMKMDIGKTNPNKAYQKLNSVLKSADSYYKSHTGVSNLFKGNTKEGKARVDWSDKIRDILKPAEKDVKKYAYKMKDFVGSISLDKIGAVLDSDTVESRISADIAEKEAAVNKKLEELKAERSAPKAEAEEARRENADAAKTDLDAELSKAQKEIAAARNKAASEAAANAEVHSRRHDLPEENIKNGENAGKEIYPDKDAIAGSYAAIVAVHYINMQKKENKPLIQVNGRDATFSEMTKIVRNSKDFKEMLKTNDSKTLFEHSQRGNGQDLMNDYSTAHRSRMNAKPVEGQKPAAVVKENGKQLGGPNN